MALKEERTVTKVLRHFCMEGPQVWNVYAGNAELVHGRAVIELPDYYTALNKAGSEVCSLTPWSRASVWVEQVSGNRITIAGDADVKGSWHIQVLRNDPACLEDIKRRPVVQLKRELAPGQVHAENQSGNTVCIGMPQAGAAPVGRDFAGAGLPP